MKKIYTKTLLLILITSVSLAISVNNMRIDKTYFKLVNGKNISINKTGQLTLSPEIQTIINTESLIVFDIKKIDDFLYVATGNKSGIYRVNLSNNKNIKQIYKSDEIAVSVLEYDGKDRLFFVESNTVYYYDIKKDKIEKFVSLGQEETKYIWGMLYINGKIYIATGETPKILVIDEKGNINKIFENKNENHFLAIAYNKSENAIYFSSEGQGILYRLSLKDNKIEALYDTYEDEISSIYIDENTVYFCTSSQIRKKVGEDFDYTDNFKKQEKPKEGQDKESAKQPKLKNSVYKYEKNKVSKIFTIDDVVFYTLTKIDSIILVGASNGSLYAYNLKNNWLSVHSKIQDEQVLKIIKEKDSVYVASGNIGKVYKIGLSYSNTGEIISNIVDLGSVSKLGKTTIKADTPKDTNTMIYIRGGNSEDIDNSWSDWKGPYTYKDEINIGIDKARYLQYKIILNTKNLEKTPTVDYILQVFSPQNRAPSISYFNIKQMKDKNQKSQKNETTLEWNAYDADGDFLEYKIFFKKEGEEVWLPLVENLYNTNSFSFDSTLLPDGYYNFKLTVSDSLTNIPEEAEISEEITPLFLIDNNPPSINITSSKETESQIIIEGIIEDDASIITKAFYSINAKEWVFFTPKDNIFDSKKEYFTIILPKKELKKNKETNIIFIRAIDEKENPKTIEYKIKF